MYTKGIGRVFASIYDGDGDANLLYGLIKNIEANEYLRGQALNVLVILVLHGLFFDESASLHSLLYFCRTSRTIW
ncbi:DUF1186 domain-containing protein [Paenibacillus pabuli]|uniref:DUF1186 domain-containing protein n=1 Tax=Paenibacillus pabuli TaxID=1472 RepID=UPI003D7CB08F